MAADRAPVPTDLSGCNVLDGGCNAGFCSIELARRGARVTAVDVDEEFNAAVGPTFTPDDGRGSCGSNLAAVNMQLWNWRGIDVVNAHERDPNVYVAGIREAVAEVAQGGLHPSLLMTHDFSLEQLAEAFQTLEQRPEGFLKAWIRIAA